MARIVYKTNVRSINVGKDKYLVKDKLNDRSIYKPGDKQMRKFNPDLQIIHGSLALFLSSKSKGVDLFKNDKNPHAGGYINV